MTESLYSCALSEDGSLYTWGCNPDGQLGFQTAPSGASEPACVLGSSVPAHQQHHGYVCCCITALLDLSLTHVQQSAMCRWSPAYH